MKNVEKNLVYILVFILSIGIVYSDAEEFAEAKKIIDAKTQCSKLTENQLEILGDYYMEQMHPREAHELMDKMMGGEGSESLRQIHIAIANRIYCNDINGMVNYGMMGIMMGGNLGRGLNTGGMGNMAMGNMMEYGMMQGYGLGYWYFVNLLSLILIIGLIILVYLWIMKLWRDVYGKKR